MVTAARVSAPSDRLLDPTAADWASAKEETVALAPTPWASQPSQYAQNAWRERPYGLTPAVRVAALHNGEAVFFRLAWQDETKDDALRDTTQFADAAGILFPVRGHPMLQTMGSASEPVNAWYWRADLEAPISVTATGLGTTVRQKNGAVAAAASYAGDGWLVVISRPFNVQGQDLVALRPGHSGSVGFAVWQGANQERAGVKATTADWLPLEIRE